MEPQLHAPAIDRPVTSRESLRRILLGLWVITLAGTFFLGSFPADYGALESGLADGRITEVSVTPGNRPGSEGFATQRITWRSHVRTHHTEVIVVAPGTDIEQEWLESGVAVLRGDDAGELIRAAQPGVSITHAERNRSESFFYDVRVPVWIMFAVVVGGFATLALLIWGPEPRRATRWAWFWLLGVPIGPGLFLLLSGPGAHDGTSRRLTGGWAFLIASAFGGGVLLS